MNNAIWISGIVLLISSSSPMLGCVPPTSSEAPTVSHGGEARDYVSFVDNLRRVSGLQVMPIGPVSNPIFSVPGQQVKIRNETLQVFEYPNAAAARADFDRVSNRPSIVGSKPHLYQKERLVVLYQGREASLLQELEQILKP